MFLHLLRPGPPQPLTVKNVSNLLKPEFSEEGSNNRTFENAVYAKFMKYLREAASKSIARFLTEGHKTKTKIIIGQPKGHSMVDAKPITFQPPYKKFS